MLQEHYNTTTGNNGRCENREGTNNNCRKEIAICFTNII